ncbi:MAG TPA: hypothetical protein VG294_03750 [Solirubrobacteraceae bacterium]|nr:hypothetical protein [Solirubrobacteraceae bacterium]
MLSVGARFDDDARALQAEGQRLARRRRCKPNKAVGHGGGRDGPFNRPLAAERREVRWADQQSQVGGVDRRRLDPDDDLVRPRRRDLSLLEA